MVAEEEGVVLEEEEEVVMAKIEKHQEIIICKKNGGNGRKKKNSKKDDGGIGEYRLVCYEVLPDYMKDNEFIRRYYRSEWPISHAFLSLFSWHNETLNVWTHLLGFLLFLGLTVMHLRNMPQMADLLAHLSKDQPEATIHMRLLQLSFISEAAAENASFNHGHLFSSAAASSFNKLHHPANSGTGSPSSDLRPPSYAAPMWPFLVFLAGSMFCLLSSSLCHLLCCHSRRLNLLLNRLDYAGIAVMIAASFFPPISYAFLCSPRWRFLYLSAISVFAVLAVLFLLAPEATRGSYRLFRALIFSAMGLTGLVPAVHIAVVNWGEARRTKAMAWEAAMAAFYLVGTGFFVSRVPERWRPGRFDLAGQSHQIFHVFVVAGALAHYALVLQFLEWRDDVGCGTKT